MEVFTIRVFYSKSNSLVIGVTDTSEKSKKLIKEYFGDDFKVLDFRDVRDSGIEFIMKVESHDVIYEVIVNDFMLNEL